MDRVEAAVVGAGVIGLGVARELRSRGVGVAVLERTGVGAGASGVQPGGVRQQWGTAVACRLARESIEFWRESDARLSSRLPLTFRRCGYLFAAQSEAMLARLEANVRLQNAEGIPSRIVTPQEAAALVPGLCGDAVAGGAWCAEDGYFDRPQSVVEAFAHGLDVRRAEVTALRHEGDRWRVETSAGEAIEAGIVVVAAGAETRGLLESLGVRLPVVSEDRYLFLSAPIRERLLEPLVVAPELAFAAKQLADGRLLASDLGARGDPDAGRAQWRATIRSAVERLLPRLQHVPFSLLVHGVYDVTPDHQPVLGAVEEHPGLFVACGFSGHGFMIAPAVARVVAGAALGERDELLDVLGLDRFAAGRLVPEPQLV